MAKSLNKGYHTRPLQVGAPLPPDLKGLPVPPTKEEIGAEIDRCEVELMYAIARHRKAWSAMRRRAEEREELANSPGMLASFESDPVWKKRTGDVTWWRSEVESRSAAYMALMRMYDLRVSRETRIGGVEVSPGSKITHRSTLFGWPLDGESGPPSASQYRMAKEWKTATTDNRRPYTVAEMNAIDALIEAGKAHWEPNNS